MNPRHCPECLRYSELDVIPGRDAGNYGRIRAFVCCTYCGWVFEELEDSA